MRRRGSSRKRVVEKSNPVEKDIGLPAPDEAKHSLDAFEDLRTPRRSCRTVPVAVNSVTTTRTPPIKYKVSLDNVEMVDTPNLSPKCRNRRMEPTTYEYSDTLRRRLRRRERAEAQMQQMQSESLERSQNQETSVPSSGQDSYAFHFPCGGCSKKYNCR